MDFLTAILIVTIMIVFSALFLYLYLCLLSTNQYIEEISKLLKRSFREYYKGQNIEPILINNGIDLKWTGEVEGLKEENELGFITIYTNDANLNSPINSIEEADLISGKIIRVIDEYIKDREQ